MSRIFCLTVTATLCITMCCRYEGAARYRDPAQQEAADRVGNTTCQDDSQDR